jgi:hypothetical protein
MLKATAKRLSAPVSDDEAYSRVRTPSQKPWREDEYAYIYVKDMYTLFAARAAEPTKENS